MNFYFLVNYYNEFYDNNKEKTKEEIDKMFNEIMIQQIEKGCIEEDSYRALINYCNISIEVPSLLRVFKEKQNNKMELWYIKGVDITGAEDIGLFYQGFYKSEYEAKEAIKKGRLVIKFNYPRYEICNAIAEILPDGRVIVEDHVFPNVDFQGEIYF